MDVFSVFSLWKSGGCSETTKQSISSQSEESSLRSSPSGLLSLTVETKKENLITFEGYDTRRGEKTSLISH